jgi:hypothetical protein
MWPDGLVLGHSGGSVLNTSPGSQMISFSTTIQDALIDFAFPRNDASFSITQPHFRMMMMY